MTGSSGWGLKGCLAALPGNRPKSAVFTLFLPFSPFFSGGAKTAECTKIAHRRSLAIFAADSGIAGNSAVGIKFVPFNRRENRRSLAIFFAEEIAHVGALKIARFCGGAVKIAAATAENRAILVHSGEE